MLEKVKASTDNDLDKETEDLATLMYNVALLNSGFSIDEPVNFTGTLQKLINVGFGLDRDEPIEEIEVEIDEEPEETGDKEAKDDNEEEIVIDADGDTVTHTSSADKKDEGSQDKAESSEEAEKHDDLWSFARQLL